MPDEPTNHSELQRLAKIAALERYLDEVEAELGPISPEEAAAARQWADRHYSAGGSAGAQDS